MSLPSGFQASIAAAVASFISLLFLVGGGAVAWAALSNETVLDAGVTDTYYIVASANGDYVFASGIGNKKVARIATADNTSILSTSLGNAPQSMALSPDGTRLYVPLGNDDAIVVLNTTTMGVVTTFPLPAGTFPNGIAISPSGDSLYIAGYLVNELVKMNAYTGANQSFPVCNNPLDVSISPEGLRVYVTCYGANKVDVVSTADGSVMSSINVGTSPYSATISPNGSTLYVVNEGSNSVTVIDTATLIVLDTILVGSNPRFAAVSPDGTQLAVSNYASKTLMLINSANNQILQTITPTGATYTEGVAYSARGNSLWLAAQSSNRVNRWDINPPLYTPAPTPTPTPTPTATTEPTLSATGLDATPYFLISAALMGGGVIALAVALVLRRLSTEKSE